METDRKSSEASRQDLYPHSLAQHSTATGPSGSFSEQNRQNNRVQGSPGTLPSHSHISPPPQPPFSLTLPYSPGRAADTVPVNLRFSKTINFILPVEHSMLKCTFLMWKGNSYEYCSIHCPVEYGFTFLRDGCHASIFDDHRGRR